MANRIGQQLGNYQLTHLLGEGGFAEVYLGEHIHLGTEAAIKILKTNLTHQEIDQFRTEARTVAQLKHPNIVRVLDFGVDHNTPFLVMDYAPNGTLRQLFPKGAKLSLTTILPYLKQAAAALQHAHDQKLIHRDIKPENMLLLPNNTLLLSDFGIAVVAHSSQSMTTQSITGTVAYMAPEQLQGKPRPASDQYALAVVTYEWLTGEWPFMGAYVEIAIQHAITPPPSLKQKIPNIPSAIEQAVTQALAKDPSQRFASVQIFVNTLEAAISLQQPLPPPSPSPIPPNKPAPQVIAPPQSKKLNPAEQNRLQQLQKEADEHLENSRYDKALPLYEQILQIDPTNTSSYFPKGLALSSLNRHKEALKAFEQACYFDPKNALYHSNRGGELVELQRYSEALEATNQALLLEPQLGTYRNQRAWDIKSKALTALGRSQEARQADQMHRKSWELYTGKKYPS